MKQAFSILALVLTLAGCGGSDSTPPPDPPADPTLVLTHEGLVKGVAGEGVQTFLGIPYAARR